MTLERIFVDKLFAAESYVQKSDNPHRAFEAAKHIYDLSVLANHPSMQTLYKDEAQLRTLLQIRLKEEKSRLDGVGDTQPKDFAFYTQLKGNAKVATAYEIMQRQYVFRKCDRIPYELAIQNMEFIFIQLENNKAWTTPQQSVSVSVSDSLSEDLPPVSCPISAHEEPDEPSLDDDDEWER